MTNGEKFRGSKERTEEFYRFCKNNDCIACKLSQVRTPGRIVECAYAWLDLRFKEEKLLPCPFCGGKTTVDANFGGRWTVSCNCTYMSPSYDTKEEAVAAHNRIMRGLARSAS